MFLLSRERQGDSIGDITEQLIVYLTKEFLYNSKLGNYKKVDKNNQCKMRLLNS